MQYNITIQPANITYKSESNLLEDALSQAIPLEYSCKTGDCETCKAEVISGAVLNEHGQTIHKGNILTCQSKALTDTTLKANYYPELTEIKIQTLPCKIASIQQVTNDIIILTLRLPPTANFEYLSGQYIDLSFKNLKRSYSIANTKASSNELELHIRKVPAGQMSDLLFNQFKENQLMRIEGPKGTFFAHKNEKPLILLATGTGIAPIKAIVEQLIHENDPREIYIYWGMQYEYELYCENIKQYASKYDHISFHPVLSRDNNWQGHKGYVQHAVITDFNSLTGVEIYACGSLQMIQQAKELFTEHGLPSNAFYSDAFTPAKQSN
ncbi:MULTISPECIES: FAD-binding oxidoreductase [Providencia]|uniref:FAD-binding oxidoreductase n=1 Tax=Providencia TaxID=586 RepID=UPI00234ADA09|nr:FAD-binding oxidoreductase [Providencia sp. PROV110]